MTAYPTVLDSDATLADIVRRLVDAYCPERIYLFGSQARGEAGPDSDYDLMVIVRDETPVEGRSSRLAYSALWGVGTGADVIVWTSSAFDRRVRVPASLPATVLREGKLLYVV
jgi:predicted nucleotidyltransferase